MLASVHRPSLAGVSVIEGDVFYAAATFEPPQGLAVMREKVLHRAKQIGTKASAFLLGMGDGSTAEDFGEEFVRQLARGIPSPQLAAEKRDYRFVVGVAQLRQRAASLGRIRLCAADLRPPRGAKVLAGCFPWKRGRRRLCWFSGHREPGKSCHGGLTCWSGKVTCFAVGSETSQPHQSTDSSEAAPCPICRF
jgi:hypothetical protein